MERFSTPPGSPLVGNAYDVDFVQQTASLEQLVKTYGPTFEVRLMQGSYVVCSDFEPYDELCNKKRFTITASSRGYKVQLPPVGDIASNVPKDQPNLLIMSSHKRQLPHNPSKIIEWISRADKNPLPGVSDLVFDCGKRRWKDTYKQIPKISNKDLEKGGGRRLVNREAVDAANNNMILDSFEKWDEIFFWPSVKACFGGGEDPASTSIPVLKLAISASPEFQEYSLNVRETLVLKSMAASSDKSIKDRTQLQLPAGIRFRAGDFLAVLPQNSPENIDRVVRCFDLTWDGSLHMKSNDTSLPQGPPLHITDALRSWVELSQPATRHDIKTLLRHTNDPATRMCLTSLAGEYFSSYITDKETGVLDLLETYPAIDLPFRTYLAMLPHFTNPLVYYL